MKIGLLAAALLLSACASTGGLPQQPFRDIPVPAEWVPYSRDWVLIRTPQVTAARLVYFVQRPVDEALDQARRLLGQAGWAEAASERFVNPEKFPGAWVEFRKGDDQCRVTAIEGAQATHVDLTIARRSRPP